MNLPEEAGLRETVPTRVDRLAGHSVSRRANWKWYEKTSMEVTPNAGRSLNDVQGGPTGGSNVHVD